MKERKINEQYDKQISNNNNNNKKEDDDLEINYPDEKDFKKNETTNNEQQNTSYVEKTPTSLTISADITLKFKEGFTFDYYKKSIILENISITNKLNGLQDYESNELHKKKISKKMKELLGSYVHKSIACLRGENVELEFMGEKVIVNKEISSAKKIVTVRFSNSILMKFSNKIATTIKNNKNWSIEDIGSCAYNDDTWTEDFANSLKNKVITRLPSKNAKKVLTKHGEETGETYEFIRVLDGNKYMYEMVIKEFNKKYANKKPNEIIKEEYDADREYLKDLRCHLQSKISIIGPIIDLFSISYEKEIEFDVNNINSLQKEKSEKKENNEEKSKTPQDSNSSSFKYVKKYISTSQHNNSTSCLPADSKSKTPSTLDQFNRPNDIDDYNNNNNNNNDNNNDNDNNIYEYNYNNQQL